MLALGTYGDLVNVVRERGGFDADEIAAGIVAAALTALSHSVPVDALRRAAAHLPRRVAVALLEHADAVGHVGTPAEIYREVAAREGVSLGFGIEHTQIVCEVLAEACEGECGTGLREALPDLFVPRRARSGAPARQLSATRSNLAEGRPGSSHPVCDSPPIRRVLDRDKHTLSGGRPGSERPLSDRRLRR